MSSSSERDNPGVIAPPPLIYAAGLLLGIVLNAVIPLPALSAIFWWLGLALIILAFIPGLWALVAMLRAGTNPEPSHPTTALVTSGPFRFTRNPIYLTFTLFFLGFALFTLNLWLIIILPFVLTVMIKGVIEREEDYLERKFGESYRIYKQRVRRWI